MLKLNKCQIKILLSFLILFLVSSFMEKAETAEEPLCKQINCQDGKHSYVVYLPPDYSEHKKWPVLFCFHPGGFGDYAAQLFSPAAAKYGWIVVGSLDAKNGPWEPIIEAQKAMIEDVTSRFSVDEHRLYAAGFSGGARMAYTMAYTYPDKFHGVIACGAGFGQGEVSEKVAVFHCVGSYCNNYQEVQKAHLSLTAKGIKSKLRVFEGGHQWPPEWVILEAIKWMYIK